MASQIGFAQFKKMYPKTEVTLIDVASGKKMGSGPCGGIKTVKFQNADVLFSSAGGYMGGGGLAHNIVYGTLVEFQTDKKKVVVRRFPNNKCLRHKVEFAVRSKVPYITIFVKDFDKPPDETPTDNIEDFLNPDWDSGISKFVFQDEKGNYVGFGVESVNRHFLKAYRVGPGKLVCFRGNLRTNADITIIVGWFVKCDWHSQRIYLRLCAEAEKKALRASLKKRLRRTILFVREGNLHEQTT